MRISPVRFAMLLCAGTAFHFTSMGIADEMGAQPAVSPIGFKYAMPMDGFIAININDKKTGKHVRRLVAEVSRKAGTIVEAWDGRDDDGQYVPPGDYTWTAVARPPLKLTYEITVNNAGQPPWWAPPPGKGGGGWLADHTPPQEVCAVGDYMFMGAWVAESGHAMIATDLDGNKLWGQGNALGAWQGVRMYAGDDRYAYLLNGGGILRIDTKNKFATQQVQVNQNFTRELPGDASYIGGAAVRDNHLYIAYNAPSAAWVQSSFTPDNVDMKKSMPMVWMSLGKRENYREYDYDEVAAFHAAFMDGAAPGSQQAKFGDAPKNGDLAGTLTVTFKDPVTVGSLLVQDGGVRVYALKPDAKLEDTDATQDRPDDDAGGMGGDPFDEAKWIPLKTVGEVGHLAIALADHTLMTRALRFKAARLNYVLTMNRRFADVAPEAERAMADGTTNDLGGWTVERPATNPITPYNPALMGLVWKNPQSVRGLTLVNPTQAVTDIDYFVGPPAIDPKTVLGQDQYWKQVGEVYPECFGAFIESANARNVDFGADLQTRALRFRAIHPEGWAGNFNTKGNLVTKPHNASFDAVAVYSALAPDIQYPPDLSQRITELQLGEAAGSTRPPGSGAPIGTVIRHVPIEQPGHLAFGPAGRLFVVSAGRIVTVPLDGGKSQEIISASKLEQPAGIAFDKDGLLYVADQGSRTIKVFDVKSGQLVRSIGKPGPRPLGEWDPGRFDVPNGIAIDSAGKLWVAEPSFQPKRISRWTRAGQHEKSFMGPTTYGGGGYLDEGDKSVLNYNGMKFAIDWENHTWKLASLLYRVGLPPSQGTAMPDRPLYHNGKRFLVGDSYGGFNGTGVAVVCVEKDGIAVPVAAAGNLAYWSDLDTHPDLHAAFSKLNRGEYGFVWVDRNGDGTPQASEVQITNKIKFPATYWPTRIGDDLSLNFGGSRLRPSSWRPDGTPDYNLTKFEIVSAFGSSWTSLDGHAFVVGEPDQYLAPDGKTVLWEYPDNFSGVQGSQKTSYDRPPGMLVGELHVVGHFTIAGEELFVVNGNHSDWFTFTKDGLLVGCIFGGPGSIGKRGWTMPEWIPGKTDLSDISLGEEHFFGNVVKANDGNVYAVAGHNHNSVVRVDGLEKMKRLDGAITVTKADLASALIWNIQQAAQQQQREGPKQLTMPFVANPMAIDGDLGDWPSNLFISIHEHYDDLKRKMVTDTSGAMAYDHDHLYVAANIADSSPALNGATDLPSLFKFGDALDIGLGIDPKADPQRTAPAPGDLRLLITRIDGNPVAVVYRFNVPGVPDEKRKHFRSPISDTGVDDIEVIKDANIAIVCGKYDWTVEASIPWSALGAQAPAVGSKLRGDMGVLVGDENGVRTLSRYYWSGKTQTVVADLAIEARIAPSLWGEIDCAEPDKSMHFGPGDVDLNP